MIKKLQENWNQILDITRIEHDISSVAFNTWLKKLEIHSVEDHKVILLIGDELQSVISFYRKNYEQPLKVTISEFFGEYYDVMITTPSELKKLKANSKAAKAAGEHSQTAENSNKTLNPNFTFENFIVGKNNELAQATALAVASEPGVYANPLFIYGGVGLGKTHLMQAVGNYVLSYNPDYKIIYVSAETFSSELINAIATRTQHDFKEKYRNIDMLLIDDIQFIAKKDSTQEEFFHTFNALYDGKKQIIITSDKPPKDIIGVEERLISRFKVGLTVDVQIPDFETRVAILKKRAESDEVDIDDESLHYAAEHALSSIRELEGFFKQITVFSRFRKINHITLDITKEALKDIIAPNEVHVITPTLIMNTVLEHYGNKVTMDELLSSTRRSSVSTPRQICMYLCEKYTNLTLDAIGEAIGGRDHTTVMHGIKKINLLMESDAELVRNIDIIVQKLNLPAS